MPRKILIGNELKKAQEQFERDNEKYLENAPLGVLSEGTPVQRPSDMSARRESSFRDLIRQEAKRELMPDREGIIEKREDGIYKGNSYFDNVTQKGIIEFEGPEGQIELTSGYNQEMTLDDLANITAFRYGEKTNEPRNIFMDINGVKVPVKEGEVTKEGLMNEYAKIQGYDTYKEMKEAEKEKPAFETAKDNDKKSPYDGMEIRDWD
ncbi:MAG: hypothetical protein IKT41_04345 [Clostridia bacterium]|nr:hypothetical protein [Clostridia bacterium]